MIPYYRKLFQEYSSVSSSVIYLDFLLPSFRTASPFSILNFSTRFLPHPSNYLFLSHLSLASLPTQLLYYLHSPFPSSLIYLVFTSPLSALLLSFLFLISPLASFSIPPPFFLSLTYSYLASLPTQNLLSLRIASSYLLLNISSLSLRHFSIFLSFSYLSLSCFPSNTASLLLTFLIIPFINLSSRFSPLSTLILPFLD